jgi:predicted transcriptional regulator
MKKPKETFSRREREIMDLIFREGEATAGEVMAMMADPPSYSAVRTLLRIMEEKGHLRHAQKGTRYVYSPTMPLEKAGKSALDHLVSTFFDGSASKVVSALLDDHRSALTDQELATLSELIDHARKEGR